MTDNVLDLLRRLDAAIRAAWDAKTLPASVIPAELAQECAAVLATPGGGADQLHAAIMNLPCKHGDYSGENGNLAYKLGHRDARHAAAELVAAATQDGTLRITGGGEPLSEDAILHLWDTHVAYETAGSAKQPPLDNKDKVAFARAVLRASGVSPIAPARTEGGDLGDKAQPSGGSDA